jgi:pyruvate kinase
VICLTANETIARQSSGLLKGVHAYVVDSLEDTISLIALVGNRAIEAGIAKEGDQMVVVCGQTSGSGSNNQIKVETVTSGALSTSDGTAPTGFLVRGLSFSV